VFAKPCPQKGFIKTYNFFSQTFQFRLNFIGTKPQFAEIFQYYITEAQIIQNWGFRSILNLFCATPCCFVLLTRGWGRWARGKRRGFSPAAAVRHRSRTREPWMLPVFWSFYLSVSSFPLLVFLFLRSDFFSPSLSDLRMGGNIGLKPGNSGSRRSRGVGNIVWFQQKREKKKKMGCLISKKVEQMGYDVVKTIENRQKKGSGPTPVARGGCGAKAPQLAARPKRGLQLPWYLHQNSPLVLCR